MGRGAEKARRDFERLACTTEPRARDAGPIWKRIAIPTPTMARDFPQKTIPTCCGSPPKCRRFPRELFQMASLPVIAES
jgi:hypothetical protein